MIRFTTEALAHLDDYLADVRGAVAGHPSISADVVAKVLRANGVVG